MAKKERFFLISPFFGDFNKVHEALAEAASRFQYLAFDKSDTQTPGQSMLFQDIKERIRSAAFVVADISADSRYGTQNPNVMIETGFAMGLGKEPFLISRQPIKLPSDINQHRVFSYDPKEDLDDLADSFERYLEGILIQIGVDIDRTVRRRSTEPEMLRWLIEATRVLRGRAKDLYVDESGLWSIGKISFRPSGCTFPLTHQIASDEERQRLNRPDADVISVECGVSFDDWKRGGTPFHVNVQEHLRGKDKRPRSIERHPLQLDDLDRVPQETVISAFEKHLDQVLPRFTPDLSTRAGLASRLKNMEGVFHIVRTTAITGLNLRPNRKKHWGAHGCDLEFVIPADDSVVALEVDFRRWEESKTSSPYWVRFEPVNTKGQAILNKWLNKYITRDRIERGHGAWFIPLGVEATTPSAKVAEAFREVSGQIASRYRPDSAETEDSDEGAAERIEEQVPAPVSSPDMSLVGEVFRDPTLPSECPRDG